MSCVHCGTDNPPGRKFCLECGTALALACPRCGAANPSNAKFCGECGASTEAAAVQPPISEATAAAPSTGPSGPSAERRLVSVLFADLVGFTTLSEHRDAEEVRDLLTGYFDTCRQVISRYGGTVEKFIGDAVMAVWGTPVAKEDDAERAVRTALELTAAVAALGAKVGAPDLRARAGVLTGEAAVTLGAAGQGMVAGDLVNTASRIQSAAAPGAVLVGAATKRSTDAAIAYEDAGAHELKGKAEPVPLWRALRVIGGRGGALRSTGLEPPFVGRDRDLRLVKELFHSSAEERKAHLVSVIGIGGIGKSRLSWEFFKYIDGLAENPQWHRGRCLPYGEGVTYWALAEMVRMRAGIAEGEEQSQALAKLQAAIREHVPDPEEQRWAEPRLAHLLGLEEPGTRDREDLFAAWRLLFERMAERAPTIMVFEDMQWADASMVDFIEYVLEWSRSHPLFVLTLARPELMDRRPNWGAGKRNFTSLYLEPLAAEAMEELLDGFVPGLPAELRARILERAEGVPLYAVETVRMLLDRGLVVGEANRYRLTGPVETLEVPETLHALIAARLDGLAVEERRLIQDASVLGKTFTRAALASLSGFGDEKLEPHLTSLVRKEVLGLQADPRSPERGQYGFLQDLMKRVAYETLSMRERKARHLAVVAYLETESGFDQDEIAEVLVSHYLEAYRSAPEAPDAPEIKERSREGLRRAGEHAASLAAWEEAQRYFEQAIELSDDPLSRAELHERAGQMGSAGGRIEAAHRHYEAAIELFESAGQIHPAARVSARMGEVVWAEGHIDQAVELIESSMDVLRGEPDADLAWLAAQLGRFLFFMGKPDRAAERLEQALTMAESLGLPEVLSQALNTKALILVSARGRPEEGLALLRHSLVVALDNDVSSAAQRAYYNLSNLLYYRDLHDEALRYGQEGLALARRVGERDWEWQFLANMVAVYYWTGRWDEAVATAADIPPLEEIPATRFASVELLLSLPPLLVSRGQILEARTLLGPFEAFGVSADEQERASYWAADAMVLRAEGKTAQGLEEAERLIAERASFNASFGGMKLALVEAIEAAISLGRGERAEQLVEQIRRLPVGELTPYLRAQAARFRAVLDASAGVPEAPEAGFKEAGGRFREIEVPFWLAVTLLEHAEWLAGQGRGAEAEPLVREAGEIFERLKARPWLERLAAVRAGTPQLSPVVAEGGS